MTPLIKKISSMIPVDHDSVWFDQSFGMKQKIETLCAETLTHLPFKKMCIVGHSKSDNMDHVLIINDGGNAISVIGYGLSDNKYTKMPAFFYRQSNSVIQVAPIDDEQKADPDVFKPAMVIIQCLLSSLTATGYKMIPRKSPTNARRAAKGKPPLSVDWHTVTIAPKASQEGHANGTHASPRKHQRRGHWRNHPNGKRVWVRDCWVGDAVKGMVFKDYKIEAFQ